MGWCATSSVECSSTVMDAGAGSLSYTQYLLQHLFALQHRSLADASKRQYEISWRQWCTFCGRIGIPPWLAPTQPSQQSLCLALFAVHCWTGDLPRGQISATSVRQKLSHVRWYHCLYAGFEPRLSTGHSLALAGMRRASTPARSREPITIAMLQWILDRLDPREAHHRVIGGAAVLGFFFLLKSAEYLAVKGYRRTYTLQVRDVVVRDHQGKPTLLLGQGQSVDIPLRGSKTDQQGVGVTRSLGRSGHPTLCPVRAAMTLLHHSIAIRSSAESPICSVTTVRMLTADAMAKTLRLAAAASGADPSRFSCHSLRSSGATALLAAGVDSTVVMLHGRWRSDVFQRYTRYSKDTGSLAVRMARGTPETLIGREPAVPFEGFTPHGVRQRSSRS